MKKSIYYRTIFRRKNMLAVLMNKFFFAIGSYPRLLMEVFIRKNMGERYFSLSSCITVAILLAVIPPALKNISLFKRYHAIQKGEFYTGFESWYIFLFAFIVMAFVRWQETLRSGSTFDFRKFSLYAGDIHPFFKNLNLLGKKTNSRIIETVYEPVAFLLAGIALSYFGQSLGILFILTSILYAMSYIAAYNIGDEFILDKIDDIIMAEETEDIIVHDKASEQARGVRFYFDKPDAKNLRQKLTEVLTISENDTEEKTVLV